MHSYIRFSTIFFETRTSVSFTKKNETKILARLFFRSGVSEGLSRLARTNEVGFMHRMEEKENKTYGMSTL